jgi:hypothetical protein
MHGEGELGEWLKQTGREVAHAAGSELKSVAKDKAASYARSMIGEGLCTARIANRIGARGATKKYTPTIFSSGSGAICY